MVVDGMSPAAAMVPTLKDRKVRVVVTRAPDMGKACGGFYDDVVAGRLTHAGQGPLDEALASARTRKIGDAGGWGWDRKALDVNIAPLVSVTLARYGAALHRSKRSGRVPADRKSNSRVATVS